MNLTHLARADLNLLVPLEALLRDRSVTRAAERLGLSQPALSNSLAKLRRHFDDDLLQRVGNSYVLTPLAMQLRLSLATALGAIEDVFDASVSFDPFLVEREFRLLASDYATAVLGGSIADLLQQSAPRAKLRISRFDLGTIMLNQEDLVETVDGLLLPHGFVTGLPFCDLFSDRWVGLVARENDIVGDVLTQEDVGNLTWVGTYHEVGVAGAAEWNLRMQGIQVNCSMIVDSFLALPDLVTGSTRAALIESRLVPRALASGDLRVVELPNGNAHALVEALWWHPSRNEDPENRWFRTVVSEAGRQVSA